MVQFQVLGPLVVRDGGVVVDIRGRRQQLLLAALLVHANQTVSLERLVDAVWEASQPKTAEAQVRDRIRLLRQALASCPSVADPLDVIATVGQGYRLTVASGSTDLDRFDSLATAGRAALASGDTETAARLLRKALQQWRDVPFAGLDATWLGAETEAWTQRRIGVVEDRLEADLGCGRHESVADELTAMVGAQPLRERPYALLMTALVRLGRGSEAFAWYDRARRVLAEELGVAPGPLLQDALQFALGGRGVGTGPVADGRAAPPAQLPIDPAGFVGRDAELARLDSVLGQADPGADPRGHAVAVLAGTAGVGKTTLAVRWAYRAAGRFPDGQLYVNLCGFDASRAPVDPAEVLHAFLDALGVPPQQIPSTIEARTGLYRTLTADRRVLVVLDNARNAEQVRPLLPGSGLCRVIVTSRDQLLGLVATGDAQLVPVEVLSRAEAHALFSQRVGRSRVAAEQAAVDLIVDSCAGLPLALAVVAARAAAYDRFPLAALAQDVRDASANLDAFDGGDAAADLRAVFASSLRSLSEPAAQLFALLGVHPGPTFTLPAAASLAGQPARTVQPLLAELTRAHLLAMPWPGRYGMHDLLATYAAELASTLDSVRRGTAARRALDHYAQTARVAAATLSPHRVPYAEPAPLPGVQAEHLGAEDAAMAWFEAEYPVLLSAMERAGDGWADPYVVQLGFALAPFVDRRGYWREWLGIAQVAARAAARLDHPAAQSRALRDLASVHVRLGDPDAARRHVRLALELSTAAGDKLTTADAHLSLGWLAEHRGDLSGALTHAQLALDGYRAVDHRYGESHALNSVGWYLSHLDEPVQAIAACREALTLAEELGDQRAQAATADSLGYAHRRLGDLDRSAAYYREALGRYRATGVRPQQASTLVTLGDLDAERGDPDAARAAWREALAIYEALNHPNAGQVRDRLDAPPG